MLDNEIPSDNVEACNLESGVLSAADRQVLLQFQNTLPDDLMAAWPGAAPSMHPWNASSSVASAVLAAPASHRDTLHIDLYSDPAARLAQDAVVAALPAAK